MISKLYLTTVQQEALLNSFEKLCSVFWGPSLEKCREILSGDYLHPFGVLDGLLVYDPPHSLENLKKTVTGFSDDVSLFDFLEESYVRLFVNAQNGITAPLYHSCYQDTGQPDSQSGLMGESAGFMRQLFKSKKLSLANSINEPPDHLSIELEYLYFLLQHGLTKQDVKAVDEAASFAGTFMLPWVSQFRDRLLSRSTCPFYPFAAAILASDLYLVTQLEKNPRPTTISADQESFL
jgi:putative dimethyl sulfoxide reductase chaperone